ncbi:MAG TPA: hypothetical protein DCZ75_19125 [Geobacter sp.]|nr:hypothetical protein [Geobacter sp.]
MRAEPPLALRERVAEGRVRAAPRRKKATAATALTPALSRRARGDGRLTDKVFIVPTLQRGNAKPLTLQRQQGCFKNHQ